MARKHGSPDRRAERCRSRNRQAQAAAPNVSRNALEKEQIMKSAYELAMDRLSKSAPTVKLSDEKKKQLAELDSKYAAKIAEREIFLKKETAAAAQKGDFEAVAQMEKQLVSVRKTLQSELEEKKEKIRKKE
jgi:hypothetical protein